MQQTEEWRIRIPHRDESCSGFRCGGRGSALNLFEKHRNYATFAHECQLAQACLDVEMAQSLARSSSWTECQRPKTELDQVMARATLLYRLGRLMAAHTGDAARAAMEQEAPMPDKALVSSWALPPVEQAEQLWDSRHGLDQDIGLESTSPGYHLVGNHAGGIGQALLQKLVGMCSVQFCQTGRYFGKHNLTYRLFGYLLPTFTPI